LICAAELILKLLMSLVSFAASALLRITQHT